MAVAFTVAIDISNANKDDRLAAKSIVGAENARREALDPPETPLPTTPDAALLESYRITIESQTLPNAHNSYVAQGGSQKKSVLGVSYDNAPDNVQGNVDEILEPKIPTEE